MLYNGGENTTRTLAFEKEVLRGKRIRSELARARMFVPVCTTRGEILAAEAAKYVLEKLPTIQAVGQVAGVLGVSREHISRSFKRHVGCSLWSFVIALRVERAQKLLGGPLLIKEIAKDVGFGSDSSFLRAFVRHFGVVPCEYRKKVRQETLTNSERKDLRASTEPQAHIGE